METMCGGCDLEDVEENLMEALASPGGFHRHPPHRLARRNVQRRFRIFSKIEKLATAKAAGGAGPVPAR